MLSSCLLVRLCVNLQVKVTEERNGEKKFSKYFAGQGLCLTHVGPPCCKTWLWGKMEGKFAIAKREKKNEVRDFFCYWVRTHWLGAML